ncbi:hypothetical protein OSB04_031828 [Centaurea solstitialis]|uniref:Aluminum-activated malate transporter n=1 Tax=Centaurea solstitialis TaxID=347529 RepID=A0AA38SMW1_9ASTR|nr:hypothetical protein OSB04_031828 [Centaurea solstitialis]
MVSNGPEWSVNVAGGSPELEVGVAKRIFWQLQGQIFECWMKIGRFFDKAKNIATSDPKKVIHGMKVGMALSLVSLFYYMRPLYDGVGGNAMWAVMTVVVALEYSVGATIAKSFNRVTATFLAGSIGIGVHWIANQCGELEPVVLEASISILAAAATFSRFIPSVKARFDYGAMIFILTFSFVSMSGCVRDYFKDNEERFSRKQEGYKCVLNSKATEEAMANLAGWEPAHGRFKFRHPWRQYLKIGASMRSCAYCIETLDDARFAKEASERSMHETKLVFFKCLKRISYDDETMTKSTKTEFFVQEMNFAVQNFQTVFKELSKQPVLLPIAEADEENSRTCKGEMLQIVPIMAIFPLATMASLLTEIAERVEGIVVEVDEMASQAEFEVVNYKKSKGNKLSKFDQDYVVMTSLQRV